MKLLGWMHRKFRQNDADPFISMSHTCGCLLSGRTSNPPLSPMKDQRFSGDGHDYFIGGGEEHPAELFFGLLAIGTLGTGPIVVVEPRKTPTHGGGAPSSGYSAMEKETDAMESNLKAATNVEEPEKVQFPEQEKHEWLFSGKQSVDWRLQGKRLSGSAGETVDREEPAAVAERTKQRTSLGELFMKTAGDGQEEEGGERSTAGIQVMMKRLLKRRACNVLLRKGSRPAPGVPVGCATKSKLQKIMQIFHKKVHPENSMATTKKSIKSPKDGILNDAGDGSSHGRGSGGSAAGTLISPARAVEGEGDPSFNCQSNPPAPTALTGSYSSGNREYWIKTDEDYLVLEL